MKPVLALCFAILLSACSAPLFVGDAPPVAVTETTPDRFELPARFGLARMVYQTNQAGGVEETKLWTDLAERASDLGTFSPLVATAPVRQYRGTKSLTDAARAQRFKYLLVVSMYPSTGSADINLIDVGSGGVMATAQAISSDGGRRGFWGGRIRNPVKLERTTLKIAKATLPLVEEMLKDVAKRSRQK